MGVMRCSFAVVVVPVVLFALLGTACGDDSPSVAQIITVQANEYDFVTDVVPDIAAGDTVRFVVENTGRLIHEMQVLDGTGRLLDRTPRLGAGESAQVVVTFDDAGVHQVICDIDDHLSQGQQAFFEIAEPE